MKTRKIVILLVLIIMLTTLVAFRPQTESWLSPVSTQTVSGQSLSCVPTQTFFNAYRWDHGTYVRIRIDTAFTADERAEIIEAFAKWNNKNLFNCSNVFFDTNPAHIIYSDENVDGIVPQVWVEYDPIPKPGKGAEINFGVYSSGSIHYKKAVIWVYGHRIAPNPPLELKRIMLHEIGHSFGLDHAVASCLSSMGNNPDSTVTINDDLAVRSLYCPVLGGGDDGGIDNPDYEEEPEECDYCLWRWDVDDNCNGDPWKTDYCGPVLDW